MSSIKVKLYQSHKYIPIVVQLSLLSTSWNFHLPKRKLCPHSTLTPHSPSPIPSTYNVSHMVVSNTAKITAKGQNSILAFIFYPSLHSPTAPIRKETIICWWTLSHAFSSPDFFLSLHIVELYPQGLHWWSAMVRTQDVICNTTPSYCSYL